MVSLTIPGEPKGKQRPRWGKHGTYTPKDTVSYETYIKELFVIKYPDFEPMTGPLVISLLIAVSIPASMSKKKKALIASGDLLPIKKPDYDNVAKVVGDALESVAYKRDAQIVSAVINKDYSDRPRLEIKIEET